MIKRLLSALVLVIVLALPVVFGPAWVLLLFAMIVIPWCVYELMHATLSKSASVLGYILMAGTVGCLWYSYQADFFLLYVIMAGITLSIIIAGLYLFEKKMATGRDVALALSGIIYPIGLFTFWVLLRNAPDGRFWMIFGLLCTFIADGGAYFAGKYLGKHKLSPRLSPKKTVEGLIGGIAASVIFGLLLGLGYDKITDSVSIMEPFIRTYPAGLFILLGFVIALLDLAGDLTASMFKREFGIKDFGNIIPGHGGMLDRMDGVIPVGAALYIILSFIN
ncbi:MAG TPA: phosphatidate cytidylyltransferase [Desulfomonilia bacterium]